MVRCLACPCPSVSTPAGEAGTASGRVAGQSECLSSKRWRGRDDRAGRPAQGPAVRNDGGGRKPRADVPLADGSVLRQQHLRSRQGSRGGRQGEGLLRRHRQDGDERRRGRRQPGAEPRRADREPAERSDPPVVPRVARRERRAGLRGDTRERQRLPPGLPLHDGCRRHGVRAAGSLLRLGRLRSQPVHGQVERRPLHPPVVDQRHDAAEGDADHVEGRRRPSLDCVPRD